TTAPRMVAPPSTQAAQRSPARAGHAAPAAAGATGPAAGSAGVTRTLDASDEYDVVVIDAVEGLDLQADRTTDLRLELPEGSRLLVQKAIHDVLVSEYQQLTTGKLSALSHNFPKNLVAHRFRRADETAPRAAWTRLTQQMFQALAGALAGHFHEPERREAHDVGLGAIRGQRPLEGAEHRAAVRLIAHVDEVDDDDAAEIAQPQLPRDAHRRLEVGAEDGLLEIAMTHIGAGVHVDGGHRFGLVDHQVAAGLQRHLAIERLGDLLLDAVEVEYQPRAGVQFDERRRPGHEGGGELLHTLVLARRIDQHAAHAAAELIAQHPQAQRQVLVYHRAGRHLAGTRAHVIPQLGEIGHDLAPGLGSGPLRCRAHDVTAARAGGQQLRQHRLQSRAFGLVLDARRHPDRLTARQVHQIARRQGNEGGEPRTLGADGVLDHLHQDVVAAVHQPPD